MTPDLTFDAERHEYTIAGRRVPSVTEVIGSVLPGYQADPFYLSRGSALHLACKYFDQGRLDRSSVAPEIEGRLRAWERFRREYPAADLAIEEAMGHAVYGFAGTLDRVLARAGVAGSLLVDIKSSSAPQTIVQLGAYRLLWHMTRGQMLKEAAEVVLNEDGTYRVTWIKKAELQRGERVFLACLSVFNFKREYLD